MSFYLTHIQMYIYIYMFICARPAGRAGGERTVGGLAAGGGPECLGSGWNEVCVFLQ